MFYIRADANSNIGMGHIMRCLSIADAAREIGCEATFILSDEASAQIVTNRGYSTIILHSDYTSLDDELPLWPEIRADFVIVDSYYVTESYLTSLKQKTCLVYLDDLASFAYPVDVIINYNAYGPSINYNSLYRQYKLPDLILGVDYAPLRAMFREVKKKKQKKDVRDIFVSLGGSDPNHLSLKMIRTKSQKYIYHILVGNMNSDKEEIKKYADDHVVIHEDVEDMKTLISACDIAVSAAGSTLYEICACGVPLITFVTADNQTYGASAFERLGLAVNLGEIRGEDEIVEGLKNAIEKLTENYDLRVEMGQRMQTMIDGFGARRIVEQLLKYRAELL